jgi:hypothetical protein
MPLLTPELLPASVNCSAGVEVPIPILPVDVDEYIVEVLESPVPAVFQKTPSFAVPVTLKVEVVRHPVQVKLKAPLFVSWPPPPKGAEVLMVMEAL